MRKLRYVKRADLHWAWIPARMTKPEYRPVYHWLRCAWWFKYQD